MALILTSTPTRMSTEPAPADLIVLPRWLIPVQPPQLVLEDYALVIHNGRIIDILPADFSRQSYAPAEVVQFPRHAVLPGLVNIHAHAAMSLLRGLADDRTLMEWLSNHIWPAEAAHISREYCRDGVELACAEMIRGGQTCFNDMYFFPDVTAEVVSKAGMRATVGLIVLDFPTAWAQNADEYIHKGLEIHDALRGDPLLRTGFAPHAPYTVSDQPLRRIRSYASELGIPIHMHLHETAHEIDTAVATDGQRPWERLRRLDLLAENFIAVHMTQLTDDEISEAAELGISVGHCPDSNMKLASGFCPVAKLLSAGVNVALGTDGAASNNDIDLIAEMRNAALLAKCVAGDAAVVPAAAALHMATFAGAKALGLEGLIGSLEAGKSADFIAVDLFSLETQPIYDVISQLVYAAGRQHVTDVYVAGRPLMRDRRLQTIDEARTLARTEEWRTRIAGG